MMYRRVNIHPVDQDFQTIFWRDKRENEIQAFRLNTVTYGATSAPYLATRELKQLALDKKKTVEIQLSWDDPVPVQVSQKWKAMCEEINLLNSIHVPRNILLPVRTTVEFHEFCYASEKGYGEVIYVRVSEIQSIFPEENWFHVHGKENPADCASRGVLPSELIDHELWWSGPEWLMTSDIPFFTDVPNCKEALKEERKQTSCAIGLSVEELPIILRISSFRKLQRVLAWCFRFLSNVQFPLRKKKFGALTTK
ncbi:retrovirus-related Pol polyprotein from transposon 17.6 [Trichonephila clavipes]|nr:retrovirus-related Pol polyprotein from transposon 17.6 [Trichonephila clavipes]